MFVVPFFSCLSSHWEICNLLLLLGPFMNVYECLFLLCCSGPLLIWKIEKHTYTRREKGRDSGVNTGSISITQTHNKQHANTFSVVSIKVAPLNILMLINVFFHFYFAWCRWCITNDSGSSLLLVRSFVRICFCAAFVILHDRIFASCHQSHTIFRLYTYNVYVYVCVYPIDFTI